ncbi:hypothetical protein PspLS_06986, partial [Pyricularia sp. CBS 133598]
MVAWCVMYAGEYCESFVIQHFGVLIKLVEELLMMPPLEQGTLPQRDLTSKADFLWVSIAGWAVDVVNNPYRHLNESTGRGHEQNVPFRMQHRTPFIYNDRLSTSSRRTAARLSPGALTDTLSPFGRVTPRPTNLARVMAEHRESAGDWQWRGCPHCSNPIGTDRRAGEWDPLSDLEKLWTALLCYSAFKVQERIASSQPGHLTKAESVDRST